MKQKTKNIQNKKVEPQKETPLYVYTLVLLGVISLVYGQTVWFGFIEFDDVAFLVARQDYFSVFKNFFLGFIDSLTLEYYRPFLYCTFFIDFLFAKSSPSLYHFSNILYHFLACLLLFRLLLLMNYEKKISFLLVLFFAISPLFTQAVCWIMGRNDILLAIFTLLGLITLIKFVQTNAPKFYVFHILSLLGGLFTKESAVIIPFVCMLLLFFMLRERKKKAYLLFFSGWLLAGIFFLSLRYYAMNFGTMKTESDVVSLQLEYGIHTFLRNTPYFFEALGKFFIPYNLSVWCLFDTFTTTIGLVVYLLLFALSFFIFKKADAEGKTVLRQTFLFTAMWWFAFILPTEIIQITFNDGTQLSDYLEHRLYTPVIGIVILLIDLITRTISYKWMRYTAFRNVCIAVIVLFSGINIMKSTDFKNESTFWKASIADAPLSAYPLKMFANHLFRKGEFDTGKFYALKSMQLNPLDAELPDYLGRSYENKNMLDSSLYYFKISVQRNGQKNAEYLANLGNVYLKLNTLDTAEHIFQKSLALNPKQNNALFGMGISAYLQQRPTDARAYWLKLIEINPDFVGAYTNMIVMYINANLFEEAKNTIMLLKQRKSDYISILKQSGIDLETKYPFLKP
ncbi:MAG: hypothetical protein QM536_08375 [Chitinophagaceae bacterium]|nr:hypothetical protein [Chitinophagaceae bacterium]